MKKRGWRDSAYLKLVRFILAVYSKVYVDIFRHSKDKQQSDILNKYRGSIDSFEKKKKG